MRAAGLSALLAYGAFSQSFDAASIKPFKAVGEGKQRVFSLAPGGVTFRGVNAKEIIAAAYGVKDYQITGPAWLNNEGYEVIAKTAAPASEDQLRKMLQDLMADRFKLAIHRESKDQPVYAMLAARKTSALHEAKGDAESRIGFAKGGFGFQNYSMSKLAEYLGHLRAVNRPVLDMTGIEGAYDFTIIIGDATEDPAEAKRAIEGAFKDDSILSIIASQLGLKIESRRMPVEMLVVDRVERPTEN